MTKPGRLSALLLLAAACGRPPVAAPNVDVRSGTFRGASVLLVTIDTLRADRVGAYGGGGLTPAIDRLAAAGLRFTRAYAHVPMTLPAHTSILTGLAPPSHGVHLNGGRGLDARPTTLAERLRQSGYRTGAFIGAFVLDARFGLSRGFDEYDDRVGADRGPLTFTFVERSADRVTQAAGAWILAQRSPWFAWVHLFDPHAPYDAPPGRAANPYDNEVAFTDEALGRLVAQLKGSGRFDNTLIVVMADHGESLGEHGEATHGLFAYEPTLHIPLVIAGPHLAPQVVSGLIGQDDVMPTVLDLLGIAAPDGIDGRSFLPTIRGEAPGDAAVYFEALDASLTRNWAPLRGVVSGQWKYIDLPIPELYDLAGDPDERRNLAASDPTRRASLERRLDDLTSRAATPTSTSPAGLDADAAARLRALGYLTASGSPPPSHYTAADDPKTLVEVNRQFEQALRLAADGQSDRAAALLRQTLSARPDFAAAYLTLAAVLIDAGHAGDAVDLLNGAVSRGLDRQDILERLGAAYLASNRPAQAVVALERVSRTLTVDGLNSLGVAYSTLGRSERARDVFRQALDRAPSGATIWGNLGLLELAAGKPRDAAAAFERAVAADPALGAAWGGLGASRAAWDRRGAIEAWRHAVGLVPRDYDTLFNLASVLIDEGRGDEARSYAERFVREAPGDRYAADITRLRAWLAQ